MYFSFRRSWYIKKGVSIWNRFNKVNGARVQNAAPERELKKRKKKRVTFVTSFYFH